MLGAQAVESAEKVVEERLTAADGAGSSSASKASTGMSVFDFQTERAPCGAVEAARLRVDRARKAELAAGREHDEQQQQLSAAKAQEEEAEQATAIQAAIRAQHLETNFQTPDAEDGSMAAISRERLVCSAAPLPGEGEARRDTSHAL
jgi:hypothetical protein